MSETEEIKRRYHDRESSNRVHSANQHKTYSNFILQEREKVYEDMLRSRFNDFSAVKFLEIGAGGGGNLNFFNELGIPWNSIHANELLEERLKKLKKDYRMVNIIPGDALEIDGSSKFDIIFQSTVFTSILDQDFKERLARKMMSMLNADGIILWYDFIYNNPSNPDVRGVPVKEVLDLFPTAKKVETRKVTLAPPIGRRVGKLYPVFNKFTFLRTHIVATISF